MQKDRDDMILFMEYVAVAVIVVLVSVRFFNMGYNTAVDEIKEEVNGGVDSQ